MSKYTTSKEILTEQLKAKLLEAGDEAIQNFTGVYVTAESQGAAERLIDNAIAKMPNEQLYTFLSRYGLMPYYTYSGPQNTGLGRDNIWADNEAYKAGRRKTPTASITVTHPKMKMMARVTDDPFMPGFIVTCKDIEGNKREVHIYFTTADGQPTVRVCTSNATNKDLDDSQVIRQNFSVPFKCGRNCGNCSCYYQTELDTEPVCQNRDSQGYKHPMLDEESCQFWQ